jgi:hypothetical protein
MLGTQPTGRANARPMTGSAKQSSFRATGKLDCFVASAPRNDEMEKAGIAPGLLCLRSPDAAQREAVRC